VIGEKAIIEDLVPIVQLLEVDVFGEVVWLLV
jgi:hypothetical protein